MPSFGGIPRSRQFTMHRLRASLWIVLPLAITLPAAPVRTPPPAGQHLLYVASPGTRNYQEYGGVGVLVFDIDHGYKFVRRIPTWKPPADAPDKPPENV